MKEDGMSDNYKRLASHPMYGPIVRGITEEVSKMMAVEVEEIVQENFKNGVLVGVNCGVVQGAKLMIEVVDTVIYNQSNLDHLNVPELNAEQKLIIISAYLRKYEAEVRRAETSDHHLKVQNLTEEECLELGNLVMAAGNLPSTSDHGQQGGV